MTAPTPVLPLPTSHGESRYTWQGRPMIGVTRLLAETGFSPDYANVREDVMEQARDRGVIVHKATAEYDTTGKMPEVSPELHGYCDAYADFAEGWKPRVDLIESPAVDPLRGFCCTIDRRAHMEVTHGCPLPYVVEVKTYAPGEEIWLQLAAQSAAVRATYGLPDFPHCAYVHLKPDGKYKFAVANRQDFARYLAVVTAAATVYNWRKR